MPVLDFNAALYPPQQPEDSEEPSVVSEYQLWRVTCAQMELETEQARLKWRATLEHRDQETARLRALTDQARMEWKMLESRPKPPQPRSSRK